MRCRTPILEEQSVIREKRRYICSHLSTPIESLARAKPQQLILRCIPIRRRFPSGSLSSFQALQAVSHIGSEMTSGAKERIDRGILGGILTELQIISEHLRESPRIFDVHRSPNDSPKHNLPTLKSHAHIHSRSTLSTSQSAHCSKPQDGWL